MVIKFVLQQNGSQGRIKNTGLPAEYIFDGNLFTFGSESANNLVLPGSAAEQAVVVREAETLTFINNADGTRLNEENLLREAIRPLAAGDEIRIGDYTITVVFGENNQPETPVFLKQTASVTKSETPPPLGQNAAIDQKSGEKFGEKPAAEAKPSNNFAAVLDTLRTEEDSFYFIVKTKDSRTGHLALEKAEIPLGVNDRGAIVFNINQTTVVFGIVRKDWSGIVIEANRRAAIAVNDELLEAAAPRRLRHDDRVTFAAVPEASLVLHEPSLLVALEPLLSARNGTVNAVNSAAIEKPATAPANAPKPSLFERTFFKHFSFVEVLTMIIGTLIGAVLFFLLFELLFA